ncbi:MAG: helix-turn-helix domain-containing protein [Alphaproteobacteria bacterium]|nr:helix-turn-helix domain-containing protein [Alphaproteobacteria bacterium]
MSIKLIDQAFKLDLKPGPKSVLVALCDCHNEKTGRCDPSQGHIARKTGYCRRTINAHLERLETAGMIRRHKTIREDGGNGKCAYEIIFHKDMQKLHRGSEILAQAPCEKNAQEIKEPEILEPEELSPLAPANGFESEFEVFWAGWQPFDMAKGSKHKAMKIFIQHRKKGVPYEKIREGCRRYLEYCHRKQCRTKHACTWLHQHGWEDEYGAENAEHPNNRYTGSKRYSPGVSLSLALADQTR